MRTEEPRVSYRKVHDLRGETSIMSDCVVVSQRVSTVCIYVKNMAQLGLLARRRVSQLSRNVGIAVVWRYRDDLSGYRAGIAPELSQYSGIGVILQTPPSRGYQGGGNPARRSARSDFMTETLVDTRTTVHAHTAREIAIDQYAQDQARLFSVSRHWARSATARQSQ